MNDFAEKWIVGGLMGLGQITVLAKETLVSCLRFKLNRRDLLFQIYSIGVKSQSVTLVTGAFTGMVMAAHTAMRLGQFSADDLRRVEALLARANLPVAGPREMAPADYLPHMMRDKKVVSGQLRLVLPQGLGQAEVRADVRNDIVLASIADCQS